MRQALDTLKNAPVTDKSDSQGPPTEVMVEAAWPCRGLALQAMRALVTATRSAEVSASYSTEKRLSEGSFGYVARGRSVALGNEPVAIKFFKGTRASSEALLEALTEVQFHALLGSVEHVWPVLGAYFDDTPQGGYHGLSGHRLV